MVLNTKIKDDFHKFDYPKIEKEFSNLLQLKDLDQQIADQPSLINSFEKDFEVILAGSFEAEFDFSGSFLFLQRILYRINRLKLFWYDDLGNYSNEDSIFLFKVRNRVELAWQTLEASKLDLESLAAMNVVEGLKERVARDLDPVDSHEDLFFRDEMTETGYRRLLAIASLDGLVEASQLSRVLGGAANEIQSMVTRIFLEEYGGGHLRRKHSTFFPPCWMSLI